MLKYALFFLLAWSLDASASSYYASVHGLKMYYEIHGEGEPLVLLHGGGSSIQTTFGQVLPMLAKHHKIIAIEQQAHGHTGDIDRPLSFDQMADDTAELLKQLKINQADFFGFSNGGTVALQIAIRHPKLVRKIVLGSALYTMDGFTPEIRESFRKPIKLENMPQSLRNDYQKIAPQPEKLPILMQKLMNMLNSFGGIRAEDMKKIAAPTLIISGDQDIRPEHTVEMYRLLPHARLAVVPGGHGAYIGEATAKADKRFIESSVNLIETFLADSMP